MASKNPEVDARSTIKRALGKLSPIQKMRLIADTLRDIGLPLFSFQLREVIPDYEAEEGAAYLEPHNLRT